ncbi:prephenate dehydratase [uncultured Rikenella sp.]|uniref:prephenate dehydratase n=1 Tax=uncultured Rikenella sp. TaxID=368003 RepID=UPI002631D709|nr:prephenate dehydratase [uncultured Rikenella sp.]
MRVAIQGYEGCFHHIAAEGYFGEEIRIVPCATFRGVVKALEEGSADRALMAIENSIAGSILPNYGLLQDRRLRVVGEIYLQIRQNLLVLPEVELDDVREVWSHPMALLQCADYLDDKGWRLVETEDTALSAAQIARDGVKHAAAIAGELPARLFGLKIIAPEINTIRNNHTRFMVLRRSEECPEGENRDTINKASMYFQVGHRKGTLASVLNTMERYDINMTKLQSYPIPSDPFHYLFHLDMEFRDVWEYREAVMHMSAVSEGLTVYGEYARGRHI